MVFEQFPHYSINMESIPSCSSLRHFYVILIIFCFLYFGGIFNETVTVEPHLTTTLLIPPPRYYSHLVITATLFWPEQKLSQTISYLKNLSLYTTTLLIRATFHDPKVVVLTGFHCISLTFVCLSDYCSQFIQAVRQWFVLNTSDTKTNNLQVVIPPKFCTCRSAQSVKKMTRSTIASLM